MKSSIPLNDLSLQHKKIEKDFAKLIKTTLTSSIFIKGPVLEKFEKGFAKFLDVAHTVGLASGTDALHLALLALGIGKDNEVIMPVNTFVATAYAALFVGAKPIFVDVDPYSFNIDVKKIEKVITKKTKVIIPVHLYGHPAEMDMIMRIAKKHHLHVIEDAAQAHGATYKNKNVGSFGVMTAFSFYPGKNLGAYGDGGAIATNSTSLTKRIKELREYGSTSKYVYKRIGINSRLDSLQAGILDLKLKYLKKWNTERNKLAYYYTKQLNEKLSFIKTPQTLKDTYHVYHLYVIQTPKRNALALYLQKNGIQTGIHYPIPLHLQQALGGLGYKKGDFPVAEMHSKKILSLPLYPGLTKEQQDNIISKIQAFFLSK